MMAKRLETKTAEKREVGKGKDSEEAIERCREKRCKTHRHDVCWLSDGAHVRNMTR